MPHGLRIRLVGLSASRRSARIGRSAGTAIYGGMAPCPASRWPTAQALQNRENIPPLPPPVLLAKAHSAKAASVETDTANMFREPLAGQLALFARLIEPHLPRLDAVLRRNLTAAGPAEASDARRVKALSLITSGAAARLACAGRPAADFFEQVAYNSRRLAKLNVPPMEVVEAVGEYDRQLDGLLAKRYPRQHAALQGVRQQLHFRTLLAVNNAYYQVREAETQAFYGLLRAEMEATGLDDLLQRFILILTRTFRAEAGRMSPFGDRPPMVSRMLKRLARPCYIAAGSRDEELVLDRGMRGVFQSYWSIPFFSDGHLA